MRTEPCALKMENLSRKEENKNYYIDENFCYPLTLFF